MTKKVINLREHDGVKYDEYLHVESETFLSLSAIRSFSFLGNQDKETVIRLVVIGVDYPLDINFSAEGMGEYHRIKRELEEAFSLSNNEKGDVVFEAI